MSRGPLIDSYLAVEFLKRAGFKNKTKKHSADNKLILEVEAEDSLEAVSKAVDLVRLAQRDAKTIGDMHYLYLPTITEISCEEIWK